MPLQLARICATPPRPDRTRRDVLATMAALGFSASVVQLALMRELLAGFSGNELTIGVALSCWLALTALGTWLGAGIPACWRALVRHCHVTVGGALARHVARERATYTSSPAWEHGRAPTLLSAGTIAVALLAIGELLAIRGGRDLLFPRGVSADPIATIVVCLVVLAPFCLGSGALLVLGCRALAASGDAGAIGRVYSADAAGSIAGAAAFTFVLSRVTDHVAALCGSAVVVSAIVALVAWRRGARWSGVAALTGAVAFTLVAAYGKLDAISTQWQHHSPVVYRATSPYGRLVVTRDAGQLTFFENGVPVIYTANAAAVEEGVHYALAQRPQAESVLVIGSAVAGAAREALRYANVRSVTAVELDPTIVAAGRALLPANTGDPRITLVTGDGRRLVQDAGARFDAILIGLPDPTTLQLNRFFTAEFVAAAKRRLHPGGVLCLASGTYENFVSATLQQTVSSTRRTLDTAFAHVLVLPGGRVFFVASDAALTRDLAALLEQRGVRPALVNRHYLDAMLTPDRLADIDRAAASAAPINRDFHPVLYYFRLKRWLAQYAFSAWGFTAALAAAGLASFLSVRAVPRMIFAAGFAGSTLEIVLLVGFQAYFGSVYQQVGLIVAVFMAGLALGAVVANGAILQTSPTGTSGSTQDPIATGGARPHRAFPFPERLVRLLALAIAALALAIAAVLPHLGQIGGAAGAFLGQAAIVTFTFAVAAAMGVQFACAASAMSVTGDGRTPAARPAPTVFSADLVGAAIGAAAVSTLLLPLYGAGVVCVATAGLNLLAVGLSFGSQRGA